MKSTALDGLFTWSVYQPDRCIDFNGFFWTRPNGNVLIDPMPLDAGGLAFVRERGGARWIVLTNADHWRASGELGVALGAEIWAPALERERLSGCAVDGWFTAREELPEGLRGDVEVFPVHGGKSSVEIAFRLVPLDALLFGDVVRSHASGELMLLPEAKLVDPARVRADLRVLAGREPRAVLLGDGDSLFAGAGEVFRSFLREL